MNQDIAHLRAALMEGQVIPAHPLALDANRRIDERRQRALSRYYLDAGSGGLAVGVHTTQFPIHNNGMLEPVLRMAMEEIHRHEKETGRSVIKVAGIIGPTDQALREARLATELGYQAGLLSLAAFRDAGNDELIVHAEAVAREIPVVGFYLQTAVGGRLLDYDFWRRFFEIENVVAVKAAPFNRYQTLDVLRALADSGRSGEIALYTGNDDHIVLDLIGGARFRDDGDEPLVGFVGGLLGQWAVFTKRAVEMLDELKALRVSGGPVPQEWFAKANALTDINAALFDVANDFRGCIAGIHEALRRQGLLEGAWCLDPNETLSPGQMEEIDRIWRAYPSMRDDAFVAENLERWLA